jgi:hypothetical protein
MNPNTKNILQGISLAACPLVFAVMVIITQNHTNNNIRATINMIGRLVSIAEDQDNRIKSLELQNAILRSKVNAMEEKLK